MTNHEKSRWYLANVNELTLEQLADAMTYKWFRLNTLYHIKDKSGAKVLFEPNAEQEAFYLGQHNRDIILKARQLGFTTFKMISDLDDCLFIENFSAGCICHDFESAKDIYRNKIRFAYRAITQEQKDLLSELGYDFPEPINDKDNSYVFSNGSSIKVGTSYRGGTLQSLHISEFGKICKKYPDKAKEVVTGAFEAVAVGNVITIESTAEGRDGYFYDYCQVAERKHKLEEILTPLDFKFHFFPWYTNKGYSIETDKPTPDDVVSYFDKLSHETGVTFTKGQMDWYAAKQIDLGDDIKREYPSTPKEAFEQSVKGAYYEQQFRKIYKEGRICHLPDNSHLPVYTAWDIGVGDSTTIWFYHRVNNQVHVIDYYEASGEGLDHYAKVLFDKGYQYAQHFAPHDIDNREWSAKGAMSRRELAAQGFEINGAIYRINFEKVAKLGVDDGINYARKLLDRCVFDIVKTDRGVKCLESYRKEWNDKLGTWKDSPLHDWSSHGADAFRYLAVVEEGSYRPYSGGISF